MGVTGPQVVRLEYEPQPRQALLHSTTANWVFYGGAVGGGKSHSIRWDLIGWCLQVPGIDCYLFRRTLGELESNHIRSIREEIPDSIATYNDTKKRLEFFNGSGINFCYCKEEQDVKVYQGAEIHVLGVDEASHLTAYQLNYLLTRVRLGRFGQRVPEQYVGRLPRAVLGSNPGGPGHTFLKENFIDPASPETPFFNERYRDPNDPDDPGKSCIFIPARMTDNRYLDKGYAANLAGLPEALARALRDGDWDAVVGQALTIDRERHMVRSFVPPRHWTHFMVMDWGSAKPFSVGWYCVSEGAFLAARDGWPEKWLPPGAMVRYAEYYGWNGEADQGCRLESPEVARTILRMEEERGDPPMDYRVGDSQMWATDDGPSVATRMAAADPRFQMRPAVKDRKANYAEVLARLAGEEFDVPGIEEARKLPMVYVAAGCRHFWRTVPTLTLEETDPEKGPNTKLEDHVYDEFAYACRSRPYATTKAQREDAEFERHMRRHGRRTVSRYAT